jgi:HTH-type transcriptional regulator / antitoxin HipB
MDKKIFYTQDEARDILVGKVGTPQRDKYESNLEMFLIGELTQEDFGKLVGVQKAQISKIENGKNLTISTVIKVFKAMGVSAKLEIDKNGQRMALC